MFHSPKEGGPAAGTLPLQQLTPADELPMHLREHLHRLQLILPIISVAVMALHRQNAELDEEIATVLDHHASQALEDEIEHLENLLVSIARQQRPKAAA